jgi:acyl-CoA synthetase (AMP-forming)/AMP-acid ligase II
MSAAIDGDRPTLIGRLIYHAATRPDAIACADDDATLDFQTLLDRTRRVAAYFRSLGPAGSSVVLYTCNQSAFFPWFLGALWAGWWVLPLQRALPEQERKHLLQRVGPLSVVDVCQELPTSNEASGDPSPDGGLLLPTSGTTDRAKIVCRSAQSLDAVSANMVDAIGFTADTHVAAAVSLTHSYGIEHGLLAPIYAGSRVTLLRGMDANQIAAALAHGVDFLPAVPAMVERLVQMHDVLPPRYIYSAGAPLPASVAAGYREKFGRHVGQLYGMTEIGSITYQSPDAPDYHAASVGLPMRGVSLRIDNETGELLVSAPSMLDRYLDEPAPIRDGHFVTGDLARVDESGRLFITGRSRLLIESAGRKINPLEIEAVLQTHPKVAACVVVPIRQTDTVQRLRAIIEPTRMDDLPTDEELRMFAQSRLARYKVPRVFECREHLPRSRTGKILRSELEKT